MLLLAKAKLSVYFFSFCGTYYEASCWTFLGPNKIKEITEILFAGEKL